MYGSIFRMRPKAGKAGELRDTMMNNDRRPKGMVTAYMLTEEKAGEVWGFGVFEDENTYRANAADPAQDANYQVFRQLLEADPEWHDGMIAQRPA